MAELRISVGQIRCLKVVARSSLHEIAPDSTRSLPESPAGSPSELTHAKRKQDGEARKAHVAAAKKARIDGSVNQELAEDRSEELTGRVGFSSKTHVAKDPQPTEITTELKGAALAKLMLAYDGTSTTESWDVGRVKDVISLSVAGPNGQSQPHTHLIKWQIGLNGRGDIHDLRLSIDSCGLNGEWLVVQAKAAKPPPRRSRRRH